MALRLTLAARIRTTSQSGCTAGDAYVELTSAPVGSMGTKGSEPLQLVLAQLAAGLIKFRMGQHQVRGRIPCAGSHTRCGVAYHVRGRIPGAGSHTMCQHQVRGRIPCAGSHTMCAVVHHLSSLWIGKRGLFRTVTFFLHPNSAT